MDKFKVTVYSNLVQLGVNDEYYLRLTEAELDSLLGKLIDAKLKLENPRVVAMYQAGDYLPSKVKSHKISTKNV